MSIPSTQSAIATLSAFSPSHLRSAFSSAIRVDAEKGIVFGVSVITKGEAIGHGIWIDGESLAQFAAHGEKSSDGVKVNLKHFTAGESSPVTGTIGRLKNFHVDGDSVRADLHLLKSDANFQKILELAATMPSQFGLSVSFDKDLQSIAGKNYVRVNKLHSVDLVDDPAANPSGLFSARPQLTGRARFAAAIRIAGQTQNLSVPTIPANAALPLASLRKLSVEVFGHDLSLVNYCNGDETAQYDAIAKAFFFEHLNVPGLSYTAFQSAGTYRPDVTTLSKGRGLSAHSTAQAKVNKFFSENK